MDWKAALEAYHNGYYDVSVYNVNWQSTEIVTVDYYAEVKSHGTGFLKQAIMRRATLINGRVTEDAEF